MHHELSCPLSPLAAPVIDHQGSEDLVFVDHGLDQVWLLVGGIEGGLRADSLEAAALGKAFDELSAAGARHDACPRRRRWPRSLTEAASQ